MDRPVLSVSQLNRYIAALIGGDPRLAGVFVKGEISNFSGHYASGHLYFSLKDEGGVIKAVMFRGSASKLRFELYDGLRVTAFGKVGVYEKGGQYQLYVEEIVPEGDGALWVAYEKLKAKLDEEGLFDEEHKRPVPRYPKTVGVVTSPTGAAVQDVINILGRRFPLAEVLVYPATVQGTSASPEIAAAIKKACLEKKADVLIVGRGGGSIEDLWAFNEEETVRAVYNSEIPVISAVGHETDFTLCDFAADLRAPTPSAAAELAVPDAAELKVALDKAKRRAATALSRVASAKKEKTARLSENLQRAIVKLIGDRAAETDGLSSRLYLGAKNILSEKTAAVSLLSAKLFALDPRAVLKRGYGAVFKDGKTVSSASDLKKGDGVRIVLSEGEAEAEITDVIL